MSSSGLGRQGGKRCICRHVQLLRCREGRRYACSHGDIPRFSNPLPIHLGNVRDLESALCALRPTAPTPAQCPCGRRISHQGGCSACHTTEKSFRSSFDVKSHCNLHGAEKKLIKQPNAAFGLIRYTPRRWTPSRKPSLTASAARRAPPARPRLRRTCRATLRPTTPTWGLRGRRARPPHSRGARLGRARRVRPEGSALGAPGRLGMCLPRASSRSQSNRPRRRLRARVRRRTAAVG